MKIFKNKGETIVETLVAILIVAICFLMLQTSIVTSAKINKSSDEQNGPFVADKQNVGSCSITIKRGTNNTVIDQYYNCYKTSGGYYYYEHIEE